MWLIAEFELLLAALDVHWRANVHIEALLLLTPVLRVDTAVSLEGEQGLLIHTCHIEPYDYYNSNIKSSGSEITQK